MTGFFIRIDLKYRKFQTCNLKCFWNFHFILLTKLTMMDTSILINLSHNILILIRDSVVNNFLVMIYNPFLSLSLSHDIYIYIYISASLTYLLFPVDSSLSTLFQFLWRWKDKQTNLMFSIDLQLLAAKKLDYTWIGWIFSPLLGDQT